MERRISINGSLLTSVLAILCVVGFVLFSLPKLFGSVFASTGGTDPDAGLKILLAKHETDQQLYLDRINGRSLFVKPKPPPPPLPPIQERPEPAEQEVKPVVDPGPPPKPKAPPTYGGPEVLYPMGDTVYFKKSDTLTGYLVLRAGQPAQEGVEVLEVKPPFHIKLGWTKPGHERGEYTLSIIEGMKFGGTYAGLSDTPLLANKTTPGLVNPPETAATEMTTDEATGTQTDEAEDAEDLSEDAGSTGEATGSNDSNEETEAEEGEGDDSDDDTVPPERNF